MVQSCAIDPARWVPAVSSAGCRPGGQHRRAVGPGGGGVGRSGLGGGGDLRMLDDAAPPSLGFSANRERLHNLLSWRVDKITHPTPPSRSIWRRTEPRASHWYAIEAPGRSHLSCRAHSIGRVLWPPRERMLHFRSPSRRRQRPLHKRI